MSDLLSILVFFGYNQNFEIRSRLVGEYLGYEITWYDAKYPQPPARACMEMTYSPQQICVWSLPFEWYTNVDTYVPLEKSYSTKTSHTWSLPPTRTYRYKNILPSPILGTNCGRFSCFLTIPVIWTCASICPSLRDCGFFLFFGTQPRFISITSLENNVEIHFINYDLYISYQNVIIYSLPSSWNGVITR